MIQNIFSPQQLSSIVLGLQKGDIPVKYAYMTSEGAHAWSKIEELRIQKGQSFSDAILLEKTIHLYLQELGNPSEIAIFDFGCGTGITVKNTLQKLYTEGVGVKYHAFDISQNIIDTCKNNLGNLPGVDFNYTLIDFETSNLVDILFQIRLIYNDIPVLGLLLGNTVGNFNSMERVLSNIMESFRLEDKLVIGIERADIKNRRWYDNMMNAYQSNYVYDLITSSLRVLGFDMSLLSCSYIFNEKSNTLEGFLTCDAPMEVIIDDFSLSFELGERIRTMQSKKINESSFSRLLLDLDVRIVNIRTNQENTYVQTLISSKKI